VGVAGPFCGARGSAALTIRSAYLAADEYGEVLAEELARRGVTITRWHGRLALSPEPPVYAAWALNIWTDPREMPVPSIGMAADSLRAIQRNWGFLPFNHNSRAGLITARLPRLRPRPLKFPCAAPTGHLGAWTMLGYDRMLVSPTQTSPFVNGEVVFEEDRSGPPSRAYLKLWEACMRLGAWPQPGETCLDLGAAPGGWTWAIASLGARVTAVDRAPLEAGIAAMPGVSVRQESAFGIDPAQEPAVDWLFSDIIAYPQRLLELVKGWIASGKAGRIVCTLKFQGATDHESAEAFAALPGGRVLHLFANKHELTFLWQRGAGALGLNDASDASGGGGASSGDG
jgi:23S rRNA (cytidine2498-2'-O)-methyltransferase